MKSSRSSNAGPGTSTPAQFGELLTDEGHASARSTRSQRILPHKGEHHQSQRHDFGNWYNGASPYSLSQASEKIQKGLDSQVGEANTPPTVHTPLVRSSPRSKQLQPPPGPSKLDLNQDDSITPEHARQLLLKGFNASPNVSSLFNASFWSTEARNPDPVADAQAPVALHKQKKIDHLSFTLNKNNKPQF